MKTKLATALSIVGVLGAGSAAALVNTQILDSGPTDSGASAAVLPPPSSIELTVPMAAEAPTTIGGAASSTTATTVATTAVAPAASGFLTAFNVGDAGIVTVDVVDGRLLLVSAEPGAGWTVTRAEDDRDDDSIDVEDEVEVDFTSGSVVVGFEAHFIDGRIVPEVTSRSLAASVSNGPSSNTTAVPSNTIDDDSHDDDDSDDRDDDDSDDRDDDSDDRDDDDSDDRDDDDSDDRDDDSHDDGDDDRDDD